MKRMVIILMASSFLYACAAKYKNIYINMDTMEINTRIAQAKHIKSPKDIMFLYYPLAKNDNKQNIKITSTTKTHDKHVISLVHDGLKDDSVAARKIIIVAIKHNKYWRVKQVLESWKCWPGRGHVDWGAVRCD